MATPSTRAAAAPTCPRCHGRRWVYRDAGRDQWPLEVDCPECSDPDPDDDCRWGDDLAESSPDDSSRFAAVASRYHTDHAA